MLVTVGRSLEDSYLVLSRGSKNSRVVPINKCEANSLRPIYLDRVRDNIDNWLVEYNSMMKNMSSMVRTSDIRPVRINGNSIRINGQNISIFTRSMAQNLSLSYYFEHLSDAALSSLLGTALSQSGISGTRSQFQQRVSNIGDQIEQVSQMIRTDSINSNLNSSSFPSSLKRVENLNKDEFRWDLDYNDLDNSDSRVGCIECSRRWDLDWE